MSIRAVVVRRDFGRILRRVNFHRLGHTLVNAREPTRIDRAVYGFDEQPCVKEKCLPDVSRPAR